MPSADDVETASSDATGAAPPTMQVPPPDRDPDIGECIETVDKTVKDTFDDGEEVGEVDEEDDKKGNLYEDTFKAEDGQKVLPEPAPADELDEDDDGVATVGGKKKKSKSIASRGPTALPKNRGTGFEGEFDRLSTEQTFFSTHVPFIFVICVVVAVLPSCDELVRAPASVGSSGTICKKASF